MYGASETVIEQISSGGTVTYLHHDQAGSTRLLTGSAGTITGKCTYSAYGTPTCGGTTTIPLGYDGQYTSSDTGLIYLRNRVYDPATAQFLTRDPLEAVTGAPYNFAEDNPSNHGDASGLSSWNPFSESFWTEGNVISESPLNPIPYYEKEIEFYENGCGYLASVAHGLEGAVAGAALFAGGEGADEADVGVGIAENSAGHIFRDAAGHLAGDTPENRALIESVVKPGNFVRTEGGGEDLYRETLRNGTRAWAKGLQGLRRDTDQHPFREGACGRALQGRVWVQPAGRDLRPGGARGCPAARERRREQCPRPPAGAGTCARAASRERA